MSHSVIFRASVCVLVIGLAYSVISGGTFGYDYFFFSPNTTVTFTFVYDGNGSTSGIVPIDPNSPYNKASVVGVLGPGTLVKTGHQFGGWNTAADGGGTRYTPAQSFIINSNTTLYAQWVTPPCFTFGSLDPTFDSDGKVTTDFINDTDSANSGSLQSDGKIVLAGLSYVGSEFDFALTRYNTDGSLDTTFSGDGRVTTPVQSNSDDQAEAVALQPDGKIVTVGYSNQFNTDFGAARYHPDGAIDTTFSGDGKVTTDIDSSFDVAYSVAIQPDGKIVAAGTSGDSFAVVRYNTDGSLDTTFDGDGKVVTAFGTDDEGRSVAIQPDGKIVVAGSSWTGFGYDFAFVRYNADGSLDTTFSGDGKVTIGTGFTEMAYSVAIQADGKIVAAGYTFNGTRVFGLYRLTSNGAPDFTFDGDGRVATSVLGEHDEARAVAIQPDGKIVAGGISQNGTSNNFAVVRYNSNGSLDTTFDNDGKVTTSVRGWQDVLQSVAIQSDGKIVTAGHSSNSNGVGQDFASVRYGTDCTSPTPTSTPTNTATTTATSTQTNTATPTSTSTPVTACPLAVLPHNGSSSANARAPSTRYANSRAVYLIRASELAAAGYLSGSSPTALSWNYESVPGVSGAASLRIYLQNTTDTAYNKGTTFSTAISGMTPVHNFLTTLPATAGVFNIDFAGGDTFTYTGGGLYVAYDWGPYAGPFSTTATVYCSTSLGNGAAGGNSNSNTLTANSFRPETRLNGSPSPQNDVAVSTVYSMGEIPVGRTPPLAIQARVTNNGPQTLMNVPVTLNITGSHTFTDTQTIPVMAPCGSQQMVTFAGFQPSTIGNDTVNVSVPPDNDPTNNSQNKALNITANEFSYKHPGSPPTSGVGFAAPGIFAAKFNSSSVASVEQVKLEFFSVTSATYKVAIYRDQGGVPSPNPFYLDFSERTISAAGPTTITLDYPVTVGAGSFYVGVQQTSDTAYYYSYDSEMPLRVGSFFQSFSIFEPAWQDLAPSRFKLNIGVVLNAVQSPTPSPSPGSTPPGYFDPTFGNGGRVTTQIGTGDFFADGTSIAIQADGKIILAGFERSSGFALVRYNTDGSLDSSFGSGGIVTTPGGYAYSVVFQTDGKIIVGGYGNIGNGEFFALVRYNANGSLDSSFGNGGKVTTSILGSAICLSLALQADGKIVAAGFATDTLSGNFSSVFALTRYNSNGSLDTTFGSGGKVTTPIGNTDDLAFSVSIQQDGKIVVGGHSNNGTDADFAVVRYLSNGSLDPAFGNSGKVITPIGVSHDRGSSLAIQNDGKIVLTGGSMESLASNNMDFSAVRYNTDGTLDTAFGDAGKVVQPVGVGSDYGAGAVIQPNGKIVIAGQVYGSPTMDFGLIRLDPDGSIDTTFGNNGKMISPIGNYDDYCNAVALQPDGKIVAGGFSSTGQGTSLQTAVFAIVRYSGDGVAPTPAIGGTVTYGNAIGAPTPRFVSNVLLSGAGSVPVSTLTNFPNGTYSLSGFGSGAYTVTPSKTGGVNGISSFDAARIAQHAAGVNPLTGNQLVVADVSGNGTISSFDAGQVARYAAGVSGFGSTGNWIFTPANRNYASITGNISGEDFIALLMGEVSGNWTNTGARPVAGER
ncbi:MAG: InlB B-repeat-containing protein [Chloracidobacterium sp.]|nr:InlB B-repeat-containing protein [Chloracidobacterium sp.]